VFIGVVYFLYYLEGALGMAIKQTTYQFIILFLVQVFVFDICVLGRRYSGLMIGVLVGMFIWETVRIALQTCKGGTQIEKSNFILKVKSANLIFGK